MTRTVVFTATINFRDYEVVTFTPGYMPYLQQGKEGVGVTFYVFSGQADEVARFQFTPLPGCCGVVVSHDTVRVGTTKGSKDISNGFRELKEAFAEHLGYSAMICTTDMKNIPALKNLFKSNYEVASTFVNSRTGNHIAIGVKKL